MLLYFKFNNFYSFLDEADISFQVGQGATQSDYDFQITTTQDEMRLNKVMAVLGANGSGKTQLLKALRFLLWFISESSRQLRPNEDIPINTFAKNKKETMSFMLGFLVEKVEYRYELVIKNKRVFKESLYKKTSNQFSYLFIRSHESALFEYKQQNFLKKSLADDVNDNTSLISYSELFDIELVSKICKKLEGYKTNINRAGRVSYSHHYTYQLAEILQTNPTLKKQAEKLLCEFDTGINSLNIKEVMVFDSQTNEQELQFVPFGVHINLNENYTFELSIFEESNGTQSAFKLLGLLLPVLHNGATAIIDELDNDLHPHLLPVILDLFRSKHTNPHNAQLIFSCHTPEVFNLLNKHQIYLVEKYQQQSEAWRLDEVEGVRNDDNLYAKYMAGAFDAVPNV